MSVLSTREDLVPDSQATLEELLADDEEFLGGINCRGALVLRYRPSPTLFLTDRRFIEYRPGYFGGTTIQDRQHVGTATVSKGIFFYQLTLAGPEFRRSFRVEPTAGRQFADAVKSGERRHIDDVESFVGVRKGTEYPDGDTGIDSERGGTDDAPGRWHYGVIAGAVAALVGIFTDALVLMLLGYLSIPVAIYLDIRRVEACEYRWQPDRGLYLVGALIFPLLAVPMYLYRRHEVLGL